ncbi:hypothetical protein [uncultured Rhodoblastus sp.]|uniref:hypothetical protein n=1 Tax=uncultured Rhodoblastus sp. TaxID=543037 RepID=UPI0025FE785C|nr:hypothetical protein [uncultured Rhodoblastus sp.]
MSNFATDILRAFETARPEPDWRRPAALLAGLSGLAQEAALDLGVARRDAALMAWRRALFGSQWRAFAQCPACGTMLEYELPTAPEMFAAPEDVLEISAEGRVWRLRWPNSRDLARAAACPDRDAARGQLLARMLETPADDAPTALLLEAVAAAHKSCWSVDLQCCACPRAWNVLFDAGEFLWRELRAAARRILREVDAIARVYHWSEAEILAMSEPRRAAYLELVS